MELKQLSYFILACQNRNHSDAAKEANISASTLSENLNQLEKELGLILFRRGSLGSFPTESARWLYQHTETILQIAEAIEDFPAFSRAGAPCQLHVVTPLQFMLGRLSRGISRATQQFRSSHPHVLVSSSFGKDFGLEPPRFKARFETRELIIDYANLAITETETLLFHDEWIAIINFEKGGQVGRIVDLEQLKSRRILLPALHKLQAEHAIKYCQDNGLQAPEFIEEDVGTFPTLLKNSEPFVLLSPKSMVVRSLTQQQLDFVRLPIPLISPVVARNDHRDPLLQAYIDTLKTFCAPNTGSIVYKPKTTLRQLRYFSTINEQLNITAAAKKLNIAQPALSNQLSKLETLSGSVFFERSRAGLVPTPSVAKFIPLVHMLNDYADFVTQQAGHEAASKGERLTIGIIPVVGHSSRIVDSISNAIADWKGSYPNVRLALVEAPASVLQYQVDQGKISFGIVETNISRTMQLDMNSIDRLVVVSRAGSGLVTNEEVTINDLGSLPLILPSDISGLRQLVNHAAQAAGITISPVMEINSLSIALALIKRLPYGTILPEASTQSLRAGGEFQFTPISTPIYRRLSIIFSTDRVLTEIERVLIHTFKHHLNHYTINDGS